MRLAEIKKLQAQGHDLPTIVQIATADVSRYERQDAGLDEMIAKLFPTQGPNAHGIVSAVMRALQAEANETKDPVLQKTVTTLMSDGAVNLGSPITQATLAAITAKHNVATQGGALLAVYPITPPIPTVESLQATLDADAIRQAEQAAREARDARWVRYGELWNALDNKFFIPLQERSDDPEQEPPTLEVIRDTLRKVADSDELAE